MRFVKGNLLDAPEEFIMHGCNAQGVMGSGVAKAVKEKWPAAFIEYADYCTKYNKADSLLGTNHYYHLPKDGHDEGEDGGQVLVNAITQHNYGAGKQARYTAILSCIYRLMGEYSPSNEKYEIAIPLIGCGLGGLNWVVLKELLEEMEERFTGPGLTGVEFVVYEL